MTPTSHTTGPESILVSLEWVKKLKEAGWPEREATFFYYRRNLGPDESFREDPVLSYGRAGSAVGLPHPYSQHYAAPTAEEILRRLPPFLNRYQLTICPQKAGWGVVYSNRGDLSPTVRLSHEDTLANAAAAMYCHLVEQKLLPPQS